MILRIGHTGSPELELKLKEHVRHVLGAIAVPAEIAFPAAVDPNRQNHSPSAESTGIGRDVGDLSTLEE